MNIGEHLTEKQLSDYYGDALEKTKKREIGRHLLACDFCLKRMPPPTPEQFWAALMTENEAADSRLEKTSLAERIKIIAQLFKQPKTLVVGASALAIVLFFSAFIWLNAAKSSEAEREIAENFQPAQSVFSQNNDEKIDLPAVLPNDENTNHPKTSSTPIASERNTPAVNSDLFKQNSRIAPRKNPNIGIESKLPDDKSLRVSTTRGGVLPKCNDGLPLELTAGTSSEGVVLTWKKIRGAAKYHLYVSDDDEILVDEFETERETSYVLKKPLDPLKTYNLKVVVTLADGETVVGDSRKFTIKNLQSDGRKPQRKERSEIRCTEKN